MFMMVGYGPGAALDKGQPLPRIQTKTTLSIMLSGKGMSGMAGMGAGEGRAAAAPSRECRRRREVRCPQIASGIQLPGGAIAPYGNRLRAMSRSRTGKHAEYAACAGCLNSSCATARAPATSPKERRSIAS